MYIKQKKSKKLSVVKRIKRINKINFLKFIGILFLLVIVSLSSIYYGIYLHDTGRAGGLKVIVLNFSEQLKAFGQGTVYFVKGLFKKPENIHINISFNNYQKLVDDRQSTLEGDRQYEYVPATIDYNNESIEVRLRLKGDRKIHIEDPDEWSFRIEVKGDETLFGMKEFSIHKPRARGYIYEWIFHQALKREDILSLRYEFIDVKLNGKDLGIYALEEHFEKRLLEHNERREGPIVRFNEDFGVDFKLSVIEPYNSDKWTDSEHIKMTQQAINLLESFRNGSLKVSEVFDVKELAAYFTISDLLGSHHGIVWANMRFYYNPVTSKLEPIGFDGHIGSERDGIFISSELGIKKESGWFYEDYKDWFRMFFNNPETFDETFIREYIGALERFSETSYLENLFSEINDELEYNLSLIYRDFPLFADNIFYFGPDLYYFDKSIFTERQSYIRNRLDPSNLSIRCYLMTRDPDSIDIGLINMQSLPIEVTGIVLGDTDIELEQKVIIPYDCTLDEQSTLSDYYEINVKLPDGFVWSNETTENLTIDYKLPGSDQTASTSIYPWSYLNKDFIENDFMIQKSNIEYFDFLEIDESGKTISVTAGQWYIDKSLIIPEGYKVTAGGGTEIYLLNDAKILSYSPFEFIGTKANPIIISSEDSTGQGIIVMSSDQKSLLEYVHFSNLSNPLQGGWELTGAVNFYESPVEIYHCKFMNNSSEDYLNIIRSSFLIDSTSFFDTSSDAVDIDFSDGLIRGSSFANCGNDAVDISGSKVELEDISIKNAGDKGISAGESTQMVGRKIEIKDSVIAVASKDISEVNIEELDIENCNYGLAVYQKKSEFGPSNMSVTGLSMDNIDERYLVEIGSSLIVDDQDIEPDFEDVMSILYDNNDG